jgi:hypothetical protein
MRFSSETFAQRFTEAHLTARDRVTVYQGQQVCLVIPEDYIVPSGSVPGLLEEVLIEHNESKIVSLLEHEDWDNLFPRIERGSGEVVLSHIC